MEDFTASEDRYALARAFASLHRPKWEGPDVVPRLSPEEMRDLARKIVTNEIYIAYTTEMLDASFGMMLMLTLGSAPDSFIESVGTCYAPWSEQGQRSINGFPMFFTVHFLHIDDMEPLQVIIDEMRAALGIEAVT